MPNCKSFLVTESKRKHVRRHAQFQQHRYVSCHQFFFPPARQGAEGNSHHSDRYIRGTCTILCHRQFKRCDFSICDAPRPARQKTVTIPEIIDQFHELILEDRHISAKSIAEQLAISRERDGSIIHEDLDMGMLSAKWIPKCLNADKICQRCQSPEQNLIFFLRDPNDFLS